MISVRDAAVDWVWRNIVEHLPSEEQPRELAEALVAIAEAADVPDEVIIHWIHFPREGKEFSAAAFRRHVESYRQLKAEVDERARDLVLDPCRKCSGPVQLVNGYRFCGACGEVE